MLFHNSEIHVKGAGNLLRKTDLSAFHANYFIEQSVHLINKLMTLCNSITFLHTASSGIKIDEYLCS